MPRHRERQTSSTHLPDALRSGNGSKHAMIQRFDIVVVGGGPAGMAAVACAAEGGRHVAVVDDNFTLGGQIWRGKDTPLKTAEVWRACGCRKRCAYSGSACFCAACARCPSCRTEWQLCRYCL